MSLLRPSWNQLDSHELRILLDLRIGRPGQYEDRQNNPNRLHLPLAGEKCQVILTYGDREIISVDPGQAFDAAHWDKIASEIESSILVGTTKTGREFSFSSYRVKGSWRGENSGVQILPPPADAPLAPVESAEHPFILEFPIQSSELWPITNHRRQREHRKLTLLLNVLLIGRTNLQPARASHFWGAFRHNDVLEVKWVQNSYFTNLGKCVVELPSQLTDERLQEINTDGLFREVRGIASSELCVTANLDDSICRYLQLHPSRRADFDRAAFWLDMASRQWNTSVSASFAALISAIESLINTRGPGSTARFRDFLERYAPGATLLARRNQMYDLRSGILHGSTLMTIDEDVNFGWDPPWWNERELHEELWNVTREAIRNWLRDPPAA